MLPDILNYIPDPKNGRPIADGQVYFFLGGYSAPVNIDDVNPAFIAEVTANGNPVPQPIYTSKGGTLIVGSQTNQPQLNVDPLVKRVAVYDKCGRLVYSTAYNGIGAFVDADALAAPDSAVLVGGVEAGELAKKSKGVNYLTPEMFFIAGELDATGMIMRMAAELTDGSRVEFQENEYLISYAGTGLAPFALAPYGVALLDISGLNNVTINGNNATIKCVNHDIGVNGGFLFIRGSANQSPRVRGFNFDMSFVGVNTSASYYPWCGAIVFFDEATGVKTQDQLCQGVVVEDCTFKLYHPFGGFALSGTSYLDDPNNGYKLFSIFASGDNLATTKDTQNNKIHINDCTWLKGHNGYGVWVWSYNDVQINSPCAQDWVFRYSDQTGAFVNGNIPFIRYHQFYNKGFQVNNIQFTAKPCSERTGAFAGSARAIGINTNLHAAGLSGGAMVINGGYMVAGNGDLANSQDDVLMFCNAYGRLAIDGGLLIDGIADTTNAKSGGAVLQYSSESTGGTGYGEVHVGDIKLGRNLSYLDSFQVLNGASTAADRRCKVLTISDVCSMSQLQYFLDTDGGSAAASKGIDEIRLGDILIDGTNNTVFGPSSTNSRAFRLSGEATDSISGNNIRVKGKYYEFLTSGLNAGARFVIDSYSAVVVTTRMIGAKVPILNMVINGNPEGSQVAAIGSTVRRIDGGAGTTLYVKESGAGATGWVTK